MHLLSGLIGNSQTQTVSSVEVEHGIELAIGYLERACGLDGRFAYKAEIDSGRESASYNIIRHEGAIYGLAMANRYHSDPTAVEAMVRAAQFLRMNYMGPVCVQISSSSGRSNCLKARKLSMPNWGEQAGFGCACAVHEIDSKSVPLGDLKAIGRFILFLQNEDGSFTHKYRFEGGPVQNWRSLYYPGEAALGLVALYELDHLQQLRRATPPEKR